MIASPFSSPVRTVRLALRLLDPLPVLLLGYVLGSVTAAGAVRSGLVAADLPLVSLPSLSAWTAAVACEFPIVLATVFAGMTRFPSLCRLPVFYRSLLWGYGSLRAYLSAGRSLFYFRYVLATGATLLPLCCLARLSAQLSEESSPLGDTRLFDYFCRCLFYWGLILLTLPLRP